MKKSETENRETMRRMSSSVQTEKVA